MYCKSLIVLTSVLLLAADAGLAGEDPEGAERRVEKRVYKKTPQGELAIHLHFPPDWTPQDKRPAIVLFFGGAWRQGTLRQFQPQAEYLAGRGMVAARADYRVKGRHGTTPDKCVEDGKSAVRWLRRHAAELGIDPERIAAGGGSAGGHVAAAAYTTEGLEAEGEDPSISSQPNLLVLFNPVMNTTRLAGRLVPREMATQISPNDNLTKDTPPAIIMFGTDDRLMAGGTESVAKGKKLGLVVQLWTAEGQGHGFFNRSPWREQTLYVVDQFLAKHQYVKGKPTLRLPGGLEMKLTGVSPE